jgi:hypothetical protein
MDFLNARNRLPTKIEDTRFGGFLEQVTPTQSKPIINKDSIQSIKTIPPLHLIHQAMRLFDQGKDERKDWFVYIVRFGYVMKEALMPLALLYDAVNFAEDLQEFLQWLNEGPDDGFGAFTRSLRQKLLDQVNIMSYTFTSSYGVKISLKSLMFFRGEAWVDDCGIDAIMETFQKQYGHRGTYLYVPTQTFDQWTRNVRSLDDPAFPWNLYQSTILAMTDEGKKARDANENKDIKAFAVTNLGGHWGALCVDFTAKKLLFGHSRDMCQFPKRLDALAALKKWLACCGTHVGNWSQERLDVPQQDDASGSCGINAVNAIERHFDPTVERWTGDRSKYHRTRFLQLLTESTEVCSL